MSDCSVAYSALASFGWGCEGRRPSRVPSNCFVGLTLCGGKLGALPG